MDGIHDMGGMHGFGPVDPSYETVFEREEYKRIYGINMLSILQRAYNIDKTRYYMENVSPAVYLATPYWERWLRMVERLYAELGVTPEAAELAIPEAIYIPGDKLWARFKAAKVPAPPTRPPPKFATGMRIRARRDAPATHTRLPRYVRGCIGRIEQYMGIFRFADAFASDRSEFQHIYSVRFDGAEMWGSASEPNTCVRIELYESYIEGRVDHD